MPFAGEPFAGEMSGPGNATRTGFAGAPFAGQPFAGQAGAAGTWRWTGVAAVPPAAPAKPVKARHAPRKEEAHGLHER